MSRDNGREEFIKSGLEGASAYRREACREWLERTFRVFRADGTMITEPEVKDRRLGWPLDTNEGWYAYTRLYPHEDTLSQDDWDHLNLIRGNTNKCLDACARLAGRVRSDGKSMLVSLIDDLPMFVSKGKPPTGLLSALRQREDVWLYTNYGWPGAPLRTLRRLISLVHPKQRVSLLRTQLASSKVPLGTAELVVLDLGRPYKWVWGYLNSDRPKELVSETQVDELADIVAERIDAETAERIGLSCRVAPLHKLYRKRRSSGQTIELVRRLLADPGEGTINVVRSLADRIVSSSGVEFELREQPDPQIYPLGELREYVSTWLQDEKIPGRRRT